MKSEFSLSVQYASEAQDIPKRHTFRKWVKAAVEMPCAITIRIVDLEEGLDLNRNFRGKDYATNVLTFVYDDQEPLMGDIVICAPVIAKEASDQGKSLEEHYAHMTIHGALHLQGYDHEEEEEAEKMETMEKCILERLGYPDPYRV